MDRACGECSLKHRKAATVRRKLCGKDAGAEIQLMAWKASSFSCICSIHALWWLHHHSCLYCRPLSCTQQPVWEETSTLVHKHSIITVRIPFNKSFGLWWLRIIFYLLDYLLWTISNQKKIKTWWGEKQKIAAISL